MRKYRLVAKKGEGTFSEVLKAQNVKDGKYHAIKCMKNHFDSIDQVNNLREIQALRRLSPHQHIITLEEVLYDQPTGRLALVFELMDANLYELIRGRRHYLNANLVRSYMFQLVRALHHMHRKGIFHRDIKPENILIENTSEMGRGLKLADFGSCRGIYSKQPYTEYISTRWYRAPECLLTDGYYGPEMDLWGAGCVFFEITSLYPLFPGTNELDQINRIHKVLGTPSAELLAKFKRNGAAHVNFDFPEQKGIGLGELVPHASAECVDLMKKMLEYDHQDRMSAREGLQHAYFRDIRELEARRQQGGESANDTGGKSGGNAGGGMGGNARSGKGQSSSKGGGMAGSMQGNLGDGSSEAKALPNIGALGGAGGVQAGGGGGAANSGASAAQQGATGGGGGSSSLSVHGNDGKTQMSQQRVGGIGKSINIKKQTQYKSSGAKQYNSYGQGGKYSSASLSSQYGGGGGGGQNAAEGPDESLPPIMGISGNTSKMQSAYKVGGYKTSEKSQLKKKKKSNRNGYDSKSSIGSFGGQSHASSMSYGQGAKQGGYGQKGGAVGGSSNHFNQNFKSFQRQPGQYDQRRRGRNNNGNTNG